MTRNRGESLHRRVWELLPWYVNGTLAALEQHTVEEHLDECLRCREELETCRRLGDAVRQTEEIAPSLHPAQLARVMARIEAEERGRGGRRRWRALSPFRGVRSALGSTPPLVRGALAAQLLLLLGLAGFLLRQTGASEVAPGADPGSGPPAVFRTLSDPSDAAAAPSPQVRVVFAEGITEKEARDLLLSLRGQIVAGPSPLGVYTVEIPAAPDPLDRVLAHLRAQPKVAFAEPVAGRAGGGGR